jgi:hypothetical protein
VVVLHASQLVPHCCRAQGFSMKGAICRVCREFVGVFGVQGGSVATRGLCRMR